MKKILFLLCVLSLSAMAHAISGQAYLERFMAYAQWSQNLPQQPGPDFLAFIDSDTPLATKLREKWLYQLARQKDWVNYSKYYHPSADINLQCFAQIANFTEGRTEEALKATRLLWLTGNSQPPACNVLFDLITKMDNFDEHLITQRIILALEKRNVGLARYLLKQYKQPRIQDEQLLASINQNPERITQLQPGELHDYFYLFGLKRMISTNMNKAIRYWQDAKTKQFLNEAQQQSFLIQLVLYKAMRGHEDEPLWFSKIKPVFYNEAILDWQIRFALKNQQWDQVEHLVNHSPDKEKPCWQYWLARALEVKGQLAKAKETYQTIAKNRHYYGFLASMRLNQIPNFENEKPVDNLAVLKPYQPFTDYIKSLYYGKQSLQASRLLNDFISELPKEEKSALIYWIATTLKWYGKSVYLSNTEELNNQLTLRFPVIHYDTVKEYAKDYHVSPELIYAIIRQESGFREDVVSPAGARGLMQVMPSTATVVAKRERIAYSNKDELFSSQKNINIGVAYLKQLTYRYNQHPVLVAAAYNAGPTQVNYWLKNHPPKDMDIWIDTLPWHETRNYLKNIIAFYAVYQFRLQQKADLQSFMKPL
ncbi:lytic transglycosylase domain-containing protein [Legionella micdadei]|uniref:Soluble lytic murein transglycosylase n=1 Tax=Legionella micdadei TaxID=451 RepID=A0A098GG38_LEGMI|nr:lytic transglycosylase domain-containing protein [Legionella micdadei]ARG97128.1 lytic murein transglycosylase [Legionella micdadei]ARH00614.1 lytic murein transglycosylase [Legionella micdadei]KTD29277.1 soluble lytic murein transglycosylase [Legionella micdadei]NSL17350.1 lytic transglycosylase domain-containing protein [Legionella micdadei]CEG61433.1 Soluble lytic murein transglycosylase [Legionella micdadei]